MRLTLVGAGEDLMAAVSARLRAEDKDFSRNWVVFPEKRPGYYLRQELARNQGSSFIPPRTDSLDTFIDRVYAERMGRRDRALEVLDAVALLFDIHRSDPDRLGGHFLSPDHFFSLGVKLFNDLEDLAAARLRPESLLALDQWAEEAVPRETRNRLQSLSYFYERFYGLLRDRGLSTRSSRVQAVLEALDPQLFDDIDAIVFAGFFSLTKSEAGLLKALLAWEKFSLYVLQGPGIEDVLETLGLSGRDSPAASAARPRAELVLTKCPDTHGQVFALNKALEDELRDPARLNEKKVIVLPASETLFPLYQQTLSSLTEEQYNISLGYPLTRTPIYSFFDNLLELVQSMDEEGRVYAAAYLRFALHPYTKNIYFPGTERRADLTRILFHAVEEALLGRRTRAFWALEELERADEVREAVQFLARNVDRAPDVAAFLEHLRDIHLRTLSPFRDIRNVGDFAAKLSGVLDYIYANSTARLHYFFHPYAEAFQAQLDALGRSLLREFVFGDRTSYFNLFRKVMAAGSVPFFGTPLRGLQVLGFWEARGIPFEDVYVLDANEETLPASSKADSLLPLAARRAMGLPTYRENEQRMEYYLHTLMAGARKVHFFFIENAEKERSRFLEKLIWERQKQDGQPLAESYVRTVRYAVDLQTSRPEPVRKIEGMAGFLQDFSYSASALDTYLRCPLEFYYGYVLNLREKEVVSEQTEKRNIGSLVHAILEEFFGRSVGRPLGPEDLRPEELRVVVDRQFESAFGRDPGGSAFLMKLQVEKHLADFLDQYQTPLVRALAGKGQTLRLLGLEQRLTGERTVSGRVFKLGARLDRAEMRGPALHIMDYKTSSNPRYLGIDFEALDLYDRCSWSRAASSVQIPLYALIYSQSHGLGVEDVHGSFLLLGKSRLGPEAEFSPIEEEDRDVRRSQLMLVSELIDKLLLEVTDGETPFNPLYGRPDECDRCPYGYLCGSK